MSLSDTESPKGTFLKKMSERFTRASEGVSDFASDIKDKGKLILWKIKNSAAYNNLTPRILAVRGGKRKTRKTKKSNRKTRKNRK